MVSLRSGRPGAIALTSGGYVQLIYRYNDLNFGLERFSTAGRAYYTTRGSDVPKHVVRALAWQLHGKYEARAIAFCALHVLRTTYPVAQIHEAAASSLEQALHP